MSRVLRVTVDVEVPRVPNYLRLSNGAGMVRVGDLTDSALRSLGEAWTAALLERAAAQRQTPP